MAAVAITARNSGSVWDLPGLSYHITGKGLLRFPIRQIASAILVLRSRCLETTSTAYGHSLIATQHKEPVTRNGTDCTPC